MRAACSPAAFWDRHHVLMPALRRQSVNASGTKAGPACCTHLASSAAVHAALRSSYSSALSLPPDTTPGFHSSTVAMVASSWACDRGLRGEEEATRSEAAAAAREL